MGQDNRSLESSASQLEVSVDTLKRGKAEVAIRNLLEFIGEDVSRDGLKETPARVVRAWDELTAGYRDDPKQILSKTFDEQSDEMVVLNGIQFYSTCEHHMLPFMGEASVAYMPAKRVVGISKIARVVSCYARRLQIQERMTREIANALNDNLHPHGVGVIVRAHHLCMGCRGVKQPNTELVTSTLLGKFRDDTVRSEFLRLINGARHA